MKRVAWSVCFILILLTCKHANHPPEVPVTPWCKSEEGTALTTYAFMTSTHDPDEDRISIRFDWGDGTISTWSHLIPSDSVWIDTHTFTESGTYEIRAQAKDEHGATSEWSAPFVFTVKSYYPPPGSLEVWGPDTGYIGEDYWFYARAVDPNNDSIQFQFLVLLGMTITDTIDWRPPVPSGGIDSIQLSFTLADTSFEFRAYAKNIHGSVADTFASTFIRIVDRPPTAPPPPSCKPMSYVYTPMKFSTQTSDPDPYDDALSYRFVFDNDTTAWGPPDTSIYTVWYYFDTPGLHYVRAQARDQWSRVSEWSDPTAISIKTNFVDEWPNFDTPIEICVTDDRAYIVESGTQSLVITDLSGNIIDKWQYFDTPISVDVDTNGYIYVTDAGTQTVKKLSPTGTIVAEWGGYGAANGQFRYPYDIAVYDTFVFVVDRENHRIQKFTHNGEFVTSWGGFGAGDGQFYLPTGIDIHNDTVYVADFYNNRVQIFTTSGTYISKFGETEGVEDGQFIGLRDVAVDDSGYVYTIESDNARVQKFKYITFITRWGTSGTAVGCFNNPQALSTCGNLLYVVDTENDRIQIFDLTQ